MHIYTDLASELRELNPKETGIQEETEQVGNVEIKRIRILTDAAVRKLGKKKGKYITIDAPELETRNPEVFDEAIEILAKELQKMLDFNENSTILVVGLGNSGVTPDSLGPQVVSEVHITRHIKEFMPEVLTTPIASVCAIAPGVLGITGVETMDVVNGVVENVKPTYVIVVDALASRRAARISSTIQLSDAGISPGSGVGNTRSELSRESLGVPVVAIGVPMVVYASTIIRDAISIIAEEQSLGLSEERLQSLNESLIKKQSGDMIVTPKDIDTIVKDMSFVIAEGINRALFGDESENLEALLS